MGAAGHLVVREKPGTVRSNLHLYQEPLCLLGKRGSAEVKTNLGPWGCDMPLQMTSLGRPASAGGKQVAGQVEQGHQSRRWSF